MSEKTSQEAATAQLPTTQAPPSANGGGVPPNLAQALCAVQGKMRTVTMSGENKFDRYNYAKLVDYLDVVRKPLAECGLAIMCFVSEIIPLDDRTTGKGAVEHVVRVRLTMILLHASGEKLELTGWGEGQDRADKAIYKAITGARKYLLGMALNLASGEEDPENTDREPEPEMDRREMAEWIDNAAKKAGLNDEQLSKVLTELTGDLVTMWRREKDPVLSRTINGWAKVLAKANELNLIKA